MLRNLKTTILSISCLSLSACVSINEKNEYISNASAIQETLPSCEPGTDQIQANKVTTLYKQQAVIEHSLDPDNITFLNWNIYKGNGENWQQDLSAFANTHSVMAIQEASLHEDLNVFLEDSQYSWVMNTAFHIDGAATGVMNVASAKAIHSCGFKSMEPLIRIPKSTLVSYYNIHGSAEKLLVANIHGINFTFGNESYGQQLEALYEAVKYHDGPMIVAGDFNSWSESRLELVDELIDRLSLSRLEYTVNNKTHIFGNAIDHVFYRQLQLVSKQVWQVSSSDHNPISVTFKFL